LYFFIQGIRRRIRDCTRFIWFKKIRIALSKIVKILSGDKGAQELITNIKAKIEYLQNIELHIKNSRTLHQAKVLLECGIMPPNADDMKLDVSGEGSYSVKSYLFGDAFEAYFLSGLEKLLKLRLFNLNNLDFDFLVIQPTETSNEIVISQNVLTFLENSELDKIVLLPLLTPADPIGRMKHWVGVIIENKLRDITIKYLDSENQAINLVVANQLELEKLGFSIVMDQIYVEQQRYRNCGSELIENFIYYMTGSRSTQEAAVYVHSLLMENALLDPIEYALRISENSKLIGFLSKQAPLMVDRPITDTDSNGLFGMSMRQADVRFEVLTLSEETYLSKLLSPYMHLSAQQTITMFGDSVLLVVDKEVSSSQAQVALLAQNIGAILPIQSGDFSAVSSTALVGVASSGYNSPEQQFQGQGSGFFTFIHRVIGPVTSTLNNGLMNMGNAIIDVIMQNNYIKHQLINYVYYDELSAIKAVINKPYIQLSAISDVQSLLQKHPFQWSEKDFRKIKLVVHPDKGGNDEDFRTINAFQEQVGDKDQMYQNLLPKLLPNIQTVIHKTTIGFKSFDTTVDAARLIYEPTLQNTKKAVLDCAYLYSMYQGINGVSAVISGSEAIYQIYQGEYTQALQTVATTIGYIALPSLLAYTAIPYLSLGYGIGMAAYTGYSAITNAYSFYLERTSDVESMLRSTMAYKDLTKILSESPLQQIYDFASTARGYEFELNSIALVAEKEALKSKLVEEKREFGQKLYDHIYEPLLEEKYNLLNQVLQGNIAQEEAKILKAKHIKIESDNPSYEHCMEIKDKDVDTNSEHYYCYNYEKKQLDYVLIGDNLLEVIERL